ncbi:MAG TPA: hypothetical protein VGX71_05895 [Pseudaminobacter sp.]|nr:hypothetical protein [Pseudaminobacter sp.]
MRKLALFAAIAMTAGPVIAQTPPPDPFCRVTPWTITLPASTSTVAREAKRQLGYRSTLGGNAMWTFKRDMSGGEPGQVLVEYTAGSGTIRPRTEALSDQTLYLLGDELVLVYRHQGATLQPITAKGTFGPCFMR